MPKSRRRHLISSSELGNRRSAALMVSRISDNHPERKVFTATRKNG